MTRKPWEKMTAGELSARFAGNQTAGVGDYLSAVVERHCPRCGEHRLLTLTSIAGVTQLHCDVCCARWQPESGEMVFAP